MYNLQVDRASIEQGSTIKWSRDLRREFEQGRHIRQDETKYTNALYRPFVTKHHFADPIMNDVLTKNHSAMFGPDLDQHNQVICFQATAARRPFAALVANTVADFHLFFDGTQCLPLYRYRDNRERIFNITDWGLQELRKHYADKSIGPEDIFAYTYAVLHDPVYREKYALNVLREFPRLPFYDDFWWWATSGQELLDLHIAFESIASYGLRRTDQPDEAKGVALKADKERGVITLYDKTTKTTLAGVPPDAWRYLLGSRSALEWVLDQYKEKKPKDSTIAEKFNTYRFADYKERVVDLLQRVCAVSVRTMEIVDEMAGRDRG